MAGICSIRIRFGKRVLSIFRLDGRRAEQKSYVLKSPSAEVSLKPTCHHRGNEQKDSREQADAMVEQVFGERMRAWEIESSGLGTPLPSVPYSDAKNVSNGMTACPGSPAEATSRRTRFGKQR